jgi:hypothetical protein
MAKRIIVILLSLCCYLKVHSKTQPGSDKNAIVFGERTKWLEEDQINTVSVFMDKNGFYYPDIYIADEDLINSNGELRTWYKKNIQILDSLCNSYNIRSVSTTEEKILLLNDSICMGIVRKINAKKSNYRNIYVNIHGYRKKAYGKRERFTTKSFEDNKLIESAFGNSCNENNFFVEVYWDSRYIPPTQAVSKGILKVFQNDAIPIANTVGLSLRKLVPYIDTENLRIISHSLGSRVTSELLFNANGLPEETTIMPPRQKHIKICFIAPAIGSELFKNFYSRGNITLDKNMNDNYALAIAYNPEDIILLKYYWYWGIIPVINSKATEFGNTSLGCDHDHDIEKFLLLFANEFKYTKQPEVFNCYEKTAKRKYTHMVNSYVKSKAYGSVIKFFDCD